MENQKQKSSQDNLKRKLSKKPPVVRQTLTSYKRMLKANPLLKYEEAGINIEELLKNKSSNLKLDLSSAISSSKSNLNLVGKSEFKKPDIKSAKSSVVKNPKANGTVGACSNIKIISGNCPSGSKEQSSVSKVKETNARKKWVPPKKYHTKSFVEVKSKIDSFHKPPLFKTTSNNLIKLPEVKQVKESRGLRRSFSSDNLQTKEGKLYSSNSVSSKTNRSVSEENLCNRPPVTIQTCSPIIEENASKPFMFKTPSAHERRSVSHFTPMSTIKRSSLFQSSTPFSIDNENLQERLNKWLKSRGKQLTAFNHLRCFGIHNTAKKPEQIQQIDEENKENVEIIQDKSASYENLNITTPQKQINNDVDVNNIEPVKNISVVAKEALNELQNLAYEDYPPIQCLGWLELIRDKYRKIEEQPEYWECRAVIEQSAGNVGNAVEYYKTAIVQGAEVQTVDKSLDQLLKKFSLLNISPNKSQVEKIDQEKARIIKDARNVFKSTIIQFAVQERKLKQKLDVAAEKKLTVTPVRRSTRLSRSAYISTPGVKLCMSLKEIDKSMDVNFETNKALC